MLLAQCARRGLFIAAMPTAVLHPCTRPSANVLLKSWLLKTASPMGIGLHPVLRIFGSCAKDYVNRFTFWCRHHDFVVCVFLNVFNHMYAILKNCYLFHRLSMPCPALLRFRMEKSFFSHMTDFKAWMHKSSQKVFSSPINCLQMVVFNCFRLPSRHGWYSTCAAAHRLEDCV